MLLSLTLKKAKKKKNYITRTMNRKSHKPLYYLKKKRVTMRLSSMGFQHFYKLFFSAYMHLYKELSNQLFCS